MVRTADPQVLALAMICSVPRQQGKYPQAAVSVQNQGARRLVNDLGPGTGVDLPVAQVSQVGGGRLGAVGEDAAQIASGKDPPEQPGILGREPGPIEQFLHEGPHRRRGHANSVLGWGVVALG